MLLQGQAKVPELSRDKATPQGQAATMGSHKNSWEILGGDGAGAASSTLIKSGLDTPQNSQVAPAGSPECLSPPCPHGTAEIWAGLGWQGLPAQPRREFRWVWNILFTNQSRRTDRKKMDFSLTRRRNPPKLLFPQP